MDILVIAICAVICGADGWVEVELWGKAHVTWLRTFLDLPNGIPSHDTFGRVFARLDPKPFRRCFVSWMRAVSKLTQGQVVAVDGKRLRRSHDHRAGKSTIHIVSAWATANRLVLGQVKTDDQSNEITAIPDLLRLLELTGCIVTIDAVGCQTALADRIVQQGGDYLLAVKENQPQPYQDVHDLFAECLKVNFRQVPHDYYRTGNKRHGRVEMRQCWTLADAEFFDLPHMALNRLKQEHTAKVGIKAKRLKAAWDLGDLLQVLSS